MDTQNIFKKACLIQLTTSVWQGSKQIGKDVMERVGENSAWLKGTKYLIHPEHLGPLHTTTHQARDLVKNSSLPFPIVGISLIPKESISFIDERLSYHRLQFLEKVEAFIGCYDLARDEAKRHLGDLFNDVDYPSPTNIRSRFNFAWRYFAIDLPGKGKILSPEIYEKEKQKFQAMMDETRDLASIALREEFAEIVTHLTDKLNSNGNHTKMLKASTFNRLHEFLTDLTTRNIFEDEKLTELAQIARDTISGASSYGMNYDVQMRTRIRTAMSTLKTAIDESIEELPRRKIKLPIAA